MIRTTSTRFHRHGGRDLLSIDRSLHEQVVQAPRPPQSRLHDYSYSYWRRVPVSPDSRALFVQVQVNPSPTPLYLTINWSIWRSGTWGNRKHFLRGLPRILRRFCYSHLKRCMKTFGTRIKVESGTPVRPPTELVGHIIEIQNPQCNVIWIFWSTSTKVRNSLEREPLGGNFQVSIQGSSS